MSYLSSILILAALTTPGTPGGNKKHHVDAIEIYSCNFSEKVDVNFDQGPDQGQR
jgi:hypothetical protein